MKTGAAAVTLRNHDDDLRKLVERSHKNMRKRSPSDEDSDAKKREACAAKKKKKFSWTESLHNLFLEAIRSIGFDRAVPNKILEIMNVPGLTRDIVASHLQKYRNFLKRACDALHYSVDDRQSSIRHSSSKSSPPSPTSLMLNKLAYQQYSTALPSNPRNQSGIFGQPRSMLADKGIPMPGQINQINRIMTTPSNYVGYNISNLIHLTGHSNAVVPNVIGDYDQLYSNLPNTRNIHPMINNLEALSDQQPLDQGEHFDTTLGDQVMNILNQAPAQQNEGKTFATTNNIYGDQWDSIRVPSFDPAPNKQYYSQDLVNPQDQFAISSGQQINNTSYNDNTTTAPSFNYVGYDISNLRHLTGNSNAVAPNNIDDSFDQTSNEIGGYDQMYSSLPNVENINQMDQQPLDQAEPFTATLGDLVNILYQAPAQRNEDKMFATTSNFYGNTSQWDPSCVSSFDQAPKQQHCNRNLVKPQEFASSSGQLINNTIHLQPVHELDEDGEHLESFLANIWRDSDVGI